MKTLTDVHQQFAEFFPAETLKPFAYLVSKKLAEGHICLNLNEVQASLEDIPYYDAAIVEKNKSRLVYEHFVTGKDGAKQPFVLHNNRLYLQRYFNYESKVLARLRQFAQSESETVEKRMAELSSQAALISNLFVAPTIQSNVGGDNTNWQLAAAVTAVLNNFTIITGGPGTGKTTTVSRILALLFTLHPEIKVALAAPTGKAAVRLAETLNIAAGNFTEDIAKKFQALAPGTIHRLLGYVPSSPYFKHDTDNPLNYDVVIIDESSMIDVALFAKLLAAVGPNTRLILLGDKDQLASVEAGSLFGDLCKSQAKLNTMPAPKAALINSFISGSDNRISGEYISPPSHLLSGHIIELKHSHRFTGNKGIGKLSKAVIKNDTAVLKEHLQDNTDEQVTIDTGYSNEVFENFASQYVAYIKEPDMAKALQLLNRQRILCAVREGEHGLYSLNTAVETYLRNKKLITKNSLFYENRPVIITKNYYSLGLFNGDVGLMRPDKDGTMKAWFTDSENQLKPVLPGYIAGAETVFAMTIHKSQGSEYDQVLVVLPAKTNISLLTRELLYTAVTRAKSKVILQASEAVILHTASQAVQRASGIMERFEEES